MAPRLEVFIAAKGAAMGLIDKIEAKANRVQGEVDEKRGKKHGDDFLKAEGRALQKKARDRQNAEAEERSVEDSTPR